MQLGINNNYQYQTNFGMRPCINKYRQNKNMNDFFKYLNTYPKNAKNNNPPSEIIAEIIKKMGDLKPISNKKQNPPSKMLLDLANEMKKYGFEVTY